MTEKPTAQECEKLRKETKKDFLKFLKDVGLIVVSVLFIHYTSPDIWTIKDLGEYGVMVALVFNRFK